MSGSGGGHERHTTRGLGELAVDRQVLARVGRVGEDDVDAVVVDLVERVDRGLDQVETAGARHDGERVLVALRLAAQGDGLAALHVRPDDPGGKAVRELLGLELGQLVEGAARGW